MSKRLYILVLLLAGMCLAKAQCPQVFNYLGVLSNKPYWISCTGSSTYVVNFQSNSSWGTYTISWGDATPNHTAASYAANSIVSHTYNSVNPDTFALNLIIPSQNCTLTGVVVMETAVVANLQLPVGGTNAACAPAVLQFSNTSSAISKTTKFKWLFGDGTPPTTLSYTNGFPVIGHNYAVGTVTCATQVTLQAWNYCSNGFTSSATYSPVLIYERDNPTISVDKLLRCWPDNVFTFTNTSTQNCVGQGNTFPRREYWDFGNYFGGPGNLIYNWSPWPPPTVRTVTYNSVGNYSVMLRDSNLCGVDTSIINIAIINSPTANLIVPVGNICQNVPVTFTNASSPGFVYMWNFGTGGGFVNLGGGNKTFTYTSPGTYTVQLAAFFPGGGGGCTHTVSSVINVQPSPTVNFAFSPPFGCSTLSNVTFTDQSTGGISAWNWNLGNGNTSNLQTPPAQNYTTTGIYQISLAVTGTNSCINSKTLSLQVYPTPTANFIPTVACAQSITGFTNTSAVTGTNPINSYTWNFGDGGPVSFSQNPTHTYTTPATYVVQLTVSTGSCSASVSQSVNVFVKPSPLFAITPTAGCSPLAVTFTNTSLNGALYVWNFGTIPTNTSNLTNPTFTYVNGGTSINSHTVTLLVISAQGCADSLKQSVSVYPNPQLGFNVNANSGCSPFVSSYTNTSVGATTYTWNFGDGNTSFSLNPQHTYTNGGGSPLNYTLNLAATSSLGCASSMTQAMTVFPKPQYSVVLSGTTGCSPLSVTFPTLTGASSYTWNFGDGSPLSNQAGPTHVYTNTLSPSQLYTITMIAANAFGCTDTATTVVNILQQPIAGFTNNINSGCHPLALSFSNTSTGNTSNNWTFGNGATSNSLHATTIYTLQQGSAATSFSVKLVINSANNCKDSVTKVVSLFARPDAEFLIDTPYCSPSPASFTNISIGASAYSWSLTGGTTSTLSTPPLTFTNGGSSDITNTATLVAINSDNCTDTIIKTFVIHPEAKFNLTNSLDSGCTPLKVFYPAIPGVVSYQWNFGNGVGSTSMNVSATYVNTGNSNKIFTVQVIAKDNNGCADTSRKTIKVYPKPDAQFTVDKLSVIAPDQPVTFNNISLDAGTFSWMFGDGGTSSEMNPVYQYTLGGEYTPTLIAISNKGCKDTTSLNEKILVIEKSDVKVPNAFTPNSNASPGKVYDPKDLSNDVFHPVMSGVNKFRMRVWSRWGELLFETENVNEGWDGYFKDKLCPQDIYIWSIQATFIDGREFNKKGDVLLLNKN